MYKAKNIAFHDIAVHEGKGWFFNVGYNAIFQIDLETGELKLEAFIPGVGLERTELFRAIIYFNDKLYLAPLNDKRICVYDLKKQEFDFIDLDFEKYEVKGYSALFCRGTVIDDHIYFFPGRFHAIIKLNPADNSLTYIDCWYEKLAESWGGDDRWYIFFDSVSVDNDGWCVMACRRSDAILRINVLSEKFSIVKTNYMGEFSDAVKAADKYIGAYKGNKSLYEISGRGTHEISLEPGIDRDVVILEDGSNMCVIPKFGNQICIYDLNTYEKKMSYEFTDTASEPQKWIMYYKMITFCNKKIDAHRILLYLCNSGEILTIDMAECTVTSIAPKMDTETEKKIDNCLLELFKKRPVFTEKPQYELKDFLETLNRIS